MMEQADVIVVGAGVAGLLAAWRLAKAGVKVLVLEAGPRGERREALAAFHRVLAKTPESPYPPAPHAPQPSVLHLDRYYIQEGPQLFKSTYLRRVGGTTWHWLGTALRLQPNDFRLRSVYGVGVDWPISYDDLEPWYTAAEHELGVAGGSNHGSPRRNAYPMPEIPATYLDKQVAAAVKPLGLIVEVSPQARNSQDFDGRPTCCGSASCISICPIQAKYDASVHAAKAERAGARIIENAVAHLVEVGSDGRVTAIRYKRPDGSERRAGGRVFILAAHAIETPKLLLQSRNDTLPRGVANSSDQVGRNLMDHPGQLSWALAAEPLYPFRGPLEVSGIEAYRDGEFRRYHAAFRTPLANDGWSWPGGGPLDLASELIHQGLHGAELDRTIREQASRQIRVFSTMEQLPDPENRVTPAFDKPDALGLPRPRIRYRVDDYVRTGLAKARKLHEQIFKGLRASFFKQREDFEGAGHIIGTLRMGHDPKTSVVDAELRSHDHANLFLLGSGVFPTAGTANPTLTITALALRAAEHILKDLTSQKEIGSTRLS
jgi:choline dehydrogenase-like flavoprotein